MRSPDQAALRLTRTLPRYWRNKCADNTIEAISKQASLNNKPVFIGYRDYKVRISVISDFMLTHHLPGIKFPDEFQEFISNIRLLLFFNDISEY